MSNSKNLIKDQPTHLRYTDDPEARQDNEYAEAFAHYEEIGRVCRSDSSVQNDPVLQEFRDVISQVQYSSKNTPDNIPFVFVCSSSGMGKTQLPFTLDAPSMYFLYSIGESSQSEQIKLLITNLTDLKFNQTFTRSLKIKANT